jgi:hypothetical protein
MTVKFARSLLAADAARTCRRGDRMSNGVVGSVGLRLPRSIIAEHSVEDSDHLAALTTYGAGAVPNLLRRHPSAAARSDRPRLGWNIRARVAQHHHRVARGAHKVVTLLVHTAVLAMVKAVFVEPIGKVLENLEAPALHPNQHVGKPGLDRHRAIVELCVRAEHVEALRLILIGQRLAGAL